jgi:6-phosphogluconolactonase
LCLGGDNQVGPALADALGFFARFGFNTGMNRSLHHVGLLVWLLLTPLVFAREHTLYIGTFTDTTSKGIYTLRFDDSNGALSAPRVAAETPSPSFLVLSQNGHFLYAVGESDSTANAFAVDRDADALKKISSRSAGDKTGPTHLALDPTGHVLITANYDGGSVSAFPVHTDGTLGERSGFVQHQGSSVDKSRQEGPHGHGVVFSPEPRVLFVTDLGLDQVLGYEVDAAKGTLTARKPPFTPVTPGAGPRHAVFSPDKRDFYVINEMGNSISAFRCEKDGSLAPLQIVSTLPANFHGKSGAAEIAIHPNGRFVYASNRGYDSIAVFSRDTKTGALAQLEVTPCGGKAPRHFCLSPDGEWLIAANQNSDLLAVFRVDAKTGKLTATEHTVSIPHPSCVVFGN